MKKENFKISHHYELLKSKNKINRKDHRLRLISLKKQSWLISTVWEGLTLKTLLQMMH